jgi:penicillin-binding protein 2
MEDHTRKIAIQLFIIFFALLYGGRLFYLQIVDPAYKTAASANSLQRVVDYPYRGLIYDRDGKILVYNVPVYDIQVVPREVPKDLDTLALAKLLELPKTELDSLLLKAKKYSRNKPTAILKQVNSDDIAKIQDQLVDYPGFFISPRTVRGYPHQSMANALGYIGEISKTKLEKLGTYYRQGDYIGLSGLESQYENELRGQKGVKYVMVDVHGIQKGSWQNGAFDTSSTKGKNLYTSVDLELQKFGEELMTNKAGSIVAIEPSTGEILAFVSAPSYDPNVLVGREFSQNFRKLMKDSLKPLFNRAMMAMYRPGSTFKTVQSLIGLETGAIDSNFTMGCSNPFVSCHEPHPNPCRLSQGLQWSCNPYFWNVYKRIINRGVDPNTFRDSKKGYDRWRDLAQSFGLGSPLGIDLPNEKKGILPTSKYFDKIYGVNAWKYSNIYSIALGEGEIGILPVQLANLACIYANRGWYIKPHFVRGLGDKQERLPQFQEKQYIKINPKHFPAVINGMERAVNGGTVWSKARLQSIVVCGKTGTSQNPKGKDHSIFIGFAPRDNPKIAVAVFVEYAGFGGFVAAPIGTLMIEKFLNDTIARKNLMKHMIDQDFIHKKKAPEEVKADSSRKAKIKADSVKFLKITAHQIKVNTPNKNKPKAEITIPVPHIPTNPMAVNGNMNAVTAPNITHNGTRKQRRTVS